MERSSATLSKSLLESLCHHVGLPDRLPNGKENNLEEIENKLADLALQACFDLSDSTEGDRAQSIWEKIATSIHTARLLNEGGKLESRSLLRAFRELDHDQALILHVVEQNAGLIIRHIQSESETLVLFESFEVSALSENVLAATGGLQREFPGCSVAIPSTIFSDASFQSELALFLSKASHESIKRFAAKTRKAGSLAYESRDTVHPALITEMLMSLLQANGRLLPTPVTQKIVHDDVCWDNREQPWRRSPFWLVLRVGIQRQLCELSDWEEGRVCYKFMMCEVIANLIDKAVQILEPDLLSALQHKLGRRLTKLEVDKKSADVRVREVYAQLFARRGDAYESIINNVTLQIEGVWSNFKTRTKRSIPSLEQYRNSAHGSKDVKLPLLNCYPYITQILEEAKTRKAINYQHSSFVFNASSTVAQKAREFAQRCFKLAEMEAKIKKECEPQHMGRDSTDEQKCNARARAFREYVKHVRDFYDGNSEQKGVMLLLVMEMWILLDKAAINLYSLLKKYAPPFLLDIFHCLHLSTLRDMERLHGVRLYLAKRHHCAEFCDMTIFAEPVSGCFAEQYYDQHSPGEMQVLHEKILVAAKRAEDIKKQEWQSKSDEYEKYVKEMEVTPCAYDSDKSLDEDEHVRKCTKCFLRRKMKRVKIASLESPLPLDQTMQKVVIFELVRPQAFATYREVTWRIIWGLAVSGQSKADSPHTLLEDYSPLSIYADHSDYKFSLASDAKSFSQTHYRETRFPVKIEKVCLPNGLRWRYFDAFAKVWSANAKSQPSFEHHCGLAVPPTSPLAPFLNIAGIIGKSSNEIIASQTKCPPGVNIHEFLSLQALLSGEARRWPQILQELGSSNVNFSSESTVLLMSHVFSQAGPHSVTDVLGTVHRIFSKESFCEKLLWQIDARVDTIHSSWRETGCMEILINLSLRLLSFGVKVRHDKALELLDKVRMITFGWIEQLRIEIRATRDVETSCSLSEFALWASILCRSTFAVYLDDTHALDFKSLTLYIGSSITMQESLGLDPMLLPHRLKCALMRSLKLSSDLRHKLRTALLSHPRSLISSIDSILPNQNDRATSKAPDPEFRHEPNEWWLMATIETSGQSSKYIDFHLLEGHFLVDGKPIGRLPAEYQQHEVLKDLFGDRIIRVYPSYLPDMSYMLPGWIKEHEIHLGFRASNLIIRARFQGKILEFIPRDKFSRKRLYGTSRSDLPDDLLQNCTHWLNTTTKKIEIRRGSNFEGSKRGNWVIDFITRKATRHGANLVDAGSPVFRQIAQIFENFEDPRYIIVTLSSRGSLRVKLPRLELDFVVNKLGHLECPQLRSEIDPNQDAGTWYGLLSKIVLREITPQGKVIENRRSIIVPQGPINVIRDGVHVAIKVDNNSSYSRYTVNETLGRVDCSPQPFLIYSKAMFHAYTSFVLPDPLTKRTGTEEALHCLESGFSQPCMPLSFDETKPLLQMARLSPSRTYYPADLKVMQSVAWNPDFTTNMQHDGYRRLVEAIFSKSDELALFTKTKKCLPLLNQPDYPHLSARGLSRRQLYQIPNKDSVIYSASHNMPYTARGFYSPFNHAKQENVYECVYLLRSWPSMLPLAIDLVAILEHWQDIGGYKNSFHKAVLSDILDINLSAEWGSLVKHCCDSSRKDSFHLMFLLGMMAFQDNINMAIIKSLIAFATVDELKTIAMPEWSTFTHFEDAEKPEAELIRERIKNCVIPFTFKQAKPRGSRARSDSDVQLKFKHEEKQNKDTRAFVKHVLQQWPCSEPSIEGFPKSDAFNFTLALELILLEWHRMYRNADLAKYLLKVQEVLDQHYSPQDYDVPTLESEERVILPTRHRGGELLTLGDLLRMSCVSDELNMSRRRHPIQIRTNNQALTSAPSDAIGFADYAVLSKDARDLRKIIHDFITAESPVRHQYGKDLMDSYEALEKFQSATWARAKDNHAFLSARVRTEQRVLDTHFSQLFYAFESVDPRARWLKKAQLWPRVTAVTLLESLRSSAASISMGSGVRECLIRFGVSISNLQRLNRIHEAGLRNQRQKLAEEEANPGHENWDPSVYTDWLLLEIDSDFTIRPGQIDVGNATINPPSGSNSVLQMNMGQGKTSVIIPMAAAVLADGKNLHRVVVPKSLLRQTAQLLQARLGGLLGREVRHVPFSRKSSTNKKTIQTFLRIHQHIQQHSGVMIALPDHLLSFKLSGLQRLSDQALDEGSFMIKVQNWMDWHARDIIDEVDEILAIKTQLIYPSGAQKAVDGHPSRWEIAQELLRLVETHVTNLQKDFPHSIEVVERGQGRFPVIYFLRSDVEDQLVSHIVDDIIADKSSILPKDCDIVDRSIINIFVSERKISPDLLQLIQNSSEGGHFPHKKEIHLLRGLLVEGILVTALKKRWNVQYGLHRARDPIAVPYHAKGTPSEQAEWGHPDVAILLTCLSFYYDGLSIEQLRQSLQHIQSSDDPCQTYAGISYSSNLPTTLTDWNTVNIDDDIQIRQLWQGMRHQMVVIDYFLNNFVFPRHAKQFQLKLQASGWDLPLSPLQHQNRAGSTVQVSSIKTPLTTGFSGTNDSKRMLPLTVQQNDLPGLAHTNAEVLSYFLEQRNREYIVAADYKGRRLSEEGLLHEITNRGIRVLIDAGAQILELSNSDLATAWMSIHGNAPAIIYFKGNEPYVLYRTGRRAPLFASAYAEDLGECLVYLDEAHTRGTDLKISAKAKGALTLGLGQTKDHTVQAALRLRQLATSQSLVFFAPPEVHQSILDYRNKTKENFIDSYDVIHWLMEQTCRGNELLQSLYVAQGYDFYVRRQAALKNAKFLTYKIQRDLYLDCLRKPEEQTLEELYGPHQRREESLPLSSFSPAIQTQLYKLNKQRMSFHNTAGVAHTSAFHEVEQEREVAHEVENVREVQKQVDYIPHVFHSLHEDIQKFMEIGEFTAKSSAYKQAWLEIDKTSLGIKHPINISAISSRLLVSIEFTKTIKIAKSSSSDPDLGWGTNSRTTRDLPDHSADNFLRPVNWVLYSRRVDMAIIICPEEAEEIIKYFQKRSFSWSAQTALLTYAAPVTRKMLHFNDLKYYTMPDLPSTWTAPPNWLKGELGIFAGRLYFQYDEYKWLCNFLGIDNSPKSESTNKATGILDEKALIAENIWTLRAKAEAVKKPTTFTPKPLVFMQEWLSLRRKGQDFAHTPMGFVCQGKPLGPDHPFFKVVKNVVHVPVAGNKAEVVEREEEGSDVDLYDDEYEHDEDGEEYGNEDDEGKDGNDGHDDGVTIGGDS